MKIRTQDLSVRYGQTPALWPTTLEFAPGSITVLVGENGAGKTTLLDCLAGIKTPSQGIVFVGERNLNDIAPNERARTIASLSQDDSRRSDLRVKERIAHGLIPERGHHALYDEALHERVLKVAQSLNIHTLLERPLYTLSGGERRRADNARLLVANARVLMVDEPYARVDVAHRGHITRALKQKRSEGCTLVASVHDLSAAFTLADRIIGLRAGKIVVDDTPKNALSPEGLFTIFQKHAEVFDGEFGRAFVFAP